MDARRYRMVVTNRTDCLRTGALVDEQLRNWLAQPPKRYNVDAFAEGRYEIVRGVPLDHDSVTGTIGTYGRWRLRESQHPYLERRAAVTSAGCPTPPVGSQGVQPRGPGAAERRGEEWV